MPIEHIIRDYDTIYSLSQQYLGDPDRWYELVEYNKLDAPYIVRDRSEKSDNFGSGYVTVQRTNFTSPAVIKAGWTVKTKPYLVGGQVKTFVVTEDVYVPAGYPVFYIHVRCTVPGQYGNVSPGMVEIAGEEFIQNGIQIAGLINEEQFTGGSDSKVLATGDSIFIPGESEAVTPQDVAQMLEMLGGEDLDLTTGFLEADGFGDMKTVKGVDNIIQAINDRLMTEVGELPLHPEYGMNIGDIIGLPNLEQSQKLIEMEIYESLSYEDRVKNVEVLNVTVEGTTILVDLKFNPDTSNRDVITNITLDVSQRGTN